MVTDAAIHPLLVRLAIEKIGHVPVNYGRYSITEVEGGWRVTVGKADPVFIGELEALDNAGE